MAKTTHDGILFDSLSEALIYCWLEEADQEGVLTYGMQWQYNLTPKVTHVVEKQLKTKVKKVEKTLLRPSHYTSDFEVRSDYEINGLHGSLEPKVGPGDLYHYLYTIDVKGKRSPATQIAKFSLTQKFLYHIHGVYVNKVIPEKFFTANGRPHLRNLPKVCWQKANPNKLYKQWQWIAKLPHWKEVIK
jgi:hypothetical protein